MNDTMRSYYKKYFMPWAIAFLLLGVAWILLYFSAVQIPITVSNLLLLALPEMFTWFAWSILAPPTVWLINKRSYSLKPVSWRWLEHLGFAILIGICVFILSLLFFTVYYGITTQMGVDLKSTYKTHVRGHLNFFLTTGLPLNAIVYSVIGFSTLAQRYVQENIDERAKSAELRVQLREAQLGAMKMQLQPHFLFNTLNTISATLHEDAPLADKLIAQLGDFLRLTLEHAELSFVPLSSELDFVRQYLQIEQSRLEDRLNIKYEIEDQALSASVPHLLLQPLVENAIKHGISQQISGGYINIRARRKADTLILEVTNSVDYADSPSLEDAMHGTGLPNIIQRLQTSYGNKATFSLSALESTTAVRAKIQLPFSLLPANLSGTMQKNQVEGYE